MKSTVSRQALDGYLREGWQLNESSYPAPKGHYRSPMFTFVRWTKAHPDLEDLLGLEAAELVESHIKTWEPSSSDPWQTCFPESDDPKLEFVDTWHRIKWPRAELETARLSAARLPLKPFCCYSPGYQAFVSLAGHLQRNIEGSILLPCLKISAILGCRPMTISRYRRMACQDGLLQLIARGIKLQRKADEFRFSVELFDWYTGEQICPADLNICVTSQSLDRSCYTEKTEKKDSKESERLTDLQEKLTKKEVHDEKGERGRLFGKNAKASIQRRPHIPTTAELAEELETTVNIRRVF